MFIQGVHRIAILLIRGLAFVACAKPQPQPIELSAQQLCGQCANMTVTSLRKDIDSCGSAVSAADRRVSAIESRHASSKNVKMSRSEGKKHLASLEETERCTKASIQRMEELQNHRVPEREGIYDRLKQYQSLLMSVVKRINEQIKQTTNTMKKGR